MAIRAVVFDLGGVLEMDVIELVDHGLDTRWEACYPLSRNCPGYC